MLAFNEQQLLLLDLTYSVSLVYFLSVHFLLLCFCFCLSESFAQLFEIHTL